MSGDVAQAPQGLPDDVDRSQPTRRFRLGSVYRNSRTGQEMRLSAIHGDRIEGYSVDETNIFHSVTPLDFLANWAEAI